MRRRSVELVRSAVPLEWRRSIVKARIAVRRPSADRRALPSFLVIGAQRSGTSSLFKYLASHPRIVPSLRKETGYLSLFFARGPAWYRCHFPTQSTLGERRLTFEATPDYLFHPLSPGRAVELLPDAQLIAVLRDPVQRAYSHYRHEVRLGLESLSFEDALDAEEQRLTSAAAQLLDEEHCRRYLRFAYLGRGMYADQLERWLEHYDRERLLVLDSAELFRAPAAEHARALDFLGLPTQMLARYDNYSAPGASDGPADDDMSRAAYERLVEAYRPANTRLYDLLGRDLGWTW